MKALEETIEALNADRNIFALVVTGQGEKFFSAGADLKAFADGDIGNASVMAQAFGQAFDALVRFRGVSIAAVNGYAMGGGLECALACDIRIAEEHAQMALPEATVGLVEEVVPQGAALDKALELAEMAGKQSPSSVARCKTLVMSARDGRSHDDGWRMERELFIELFSTEDQREGVNAFLEKRTPEWKNR